MEPPGLKRRNEKKEENSQRDERKCERSVIELEPRRLKEKKRLEGKKMRKTHEDADGL